MTLKNHHLPPVIPIMPIIPVIPTLQSSYGNHFILKNIPFKIMPSSISSSISSFVRSTFNKYKASTLFFIGCSVSLSSYYIASYIINKQKDNKQNLWKTIGGNLLIWVLIIIMAVTALQFFSTENRPKTVAYTQFQDFVVRGIIESGKIVGRTFNGKFREPIAIEPEGSGEPKLFVKFTTVLPEVTLEMTKYWMKIK